MRFSLVTTTINVPSVLGLYRELRDDVSIVVVGDDRTPDDEVRRLLRPLGNAVYYSRREQELLGYQCSPLIGWNCIMRRNVAILEAMKLKPDVIITIDDDNIPVGRSYFDHFESTFAEKFSGLAAGSADGWFNIGQLLVPSVYHRGFPYELRGAPREIRMHPATDAQIGVSAGLWAGDPDIDAMDRIVSGPRVHNWSPLIQHGLIVSKDCYSPFNSQNTAFRSELAALMMVWIGVGRYDDIWASYAAQRVLRETPYHVHFGQPMVWQQRNPQSHWKNLRDEMHGMENTSAFTRALDEIDVGNGGPLQMLRRIFEGLNGRSFIPSLTVEAGLRWCDDVESVLCAA